MNNIGETIMIVLVSAATVAALLGGGIGIIYYLNKKKKKTTGHSDNNTAPAPNMSKEISVIPESSVEVKKEELIIPVTVLSADELPSDAQLVEITDSSLLARIDQLIPGLVQAGNTTNNAVQAARLANQLDSFEAIIPAGLPDGVKHMPSKDMPGAILGPIVDDNGKIIGQTRWRSVEIENAPSVTANVTATAMSVASMVVGQYYMSQIDAQLTQIKRDISKIADFQDTEYRGRIIALVAEVKEISAYQMDILKSDASRRQNELIRLDRLQHECGTLLGQANLALENFNNKQKLKFEVYEDEVKESQKWYSYQKPLLEVMGKIAELKYTLYMGAITREQCVVLLQEYTAQSSKAHEKLAGWHHTMAQKLGLDMGKLQRRRQGWDRALLFLPGLIHEEWNFRPIQKDIAQIITGQVMGHGYGSYSDRTELYQKDVRLINKDGKVFYLPETDTER